MGNYTLGVYSNEAGLPYFYDTTSSFHFNIEEIKGYRIKSVTITAAPVGGAEQTRFYSSGVLYNGSMAIGSWGSRSWPSSWSVSGLNVVAENSLELAITSEHTGNRFNRAYASITYEADFSVTNVGPLSGDTIASSLPNEFSWTIESIDEITSQTLYWKYASSENYTSISLDPEDTSYVFADGTFSNGTIEWYVEAVDSASNHAVSAVETVTVGIVPSVVIAYPLGVNIKSSNIQIFTWEMIESIATGQYSYELQYKEAEDEQWTTITATSANQYHSFAANTFSTGTYQWKLRVTNNDGITSEYAYGSFVAIGSTDAPVIDSVTNSSIPTITWTIASQDTFEMEIYKGAERIYTSGVQVGYNVRSFTPNLMLEDGNYIIKMRAMNQYGYFTPWLDYSFVLDPEKPDALTCYAYANDHHGVTIARSLELDSVIPDAPGEPSDVPDAHYVIRRRKGDTAWQIIGKLDTLDESVKFEDNTVLPDVAYEYAIRNYESGAGYADSNIVTITLRFLGYIINSAVDGREFVLLYKTDEPQFEVQHSSSKNQTYSYMIGRKYPVRESSEWLAHSDSFVCIANYEQYEQLLKFYSGNDDLWFRGKKFAYQCSIDELSIRDTLFDDRYTLDISVSRTDEEELRLF